MKRRVLALMIAVLSVFMTACGGAEDADVEEVVRESTVEEDTEESETEVEKEWNETEDVDVEEESEAIEEEETVASGSYYPGVYTETGYESEYLGFRYTTPEGYVIASQEEMQDMLDSGKELLSEDYSELQLAYADVVSINELMVSDATGIVNFNISLEKTPVSLETYVEVIKTQITELSAMDVEIVGEEEAELAGAVYTKLIAEVEVEGYPMRQDYYLRKQDDRVMAIIVTWMEGMEAEKDTLLSGFSAY